MPDNTVGMFRYLRVAQLQIAAFFSFIILGPNQPAQSVLAHNMIQDSSDVFQMFYIDSNVHKPTFKSSSVTATFNGVSFEDCVMKCANLHNCQAVAYRKDNQQKNQVSQCIIIDSPLIFNSNEKHKNFYFYAAHR